MIKLIACDIDGTLLKAKQKAVNPEVFNQIERLAENGINFCAASGRQYESLRTLFEPVKDKIYYICENGGAVFSNGPTQKIISKTVIDYQKAREVIDFIVSQDFCEVLVSGENTVYTIPKDLSFADYIINIVHNNCKVINSADEIKEDIVKVSVCCSKGTDYFLKLFENLNTTLSPVVSGSEWVDFTLADKGTGIKELASFLQINLSDVMAIGDNYNDLPILNIVGHPYIMENAKDTLKDRFKNHCINVEDTLKTIK